MTSNAAQLEDAGLGSRPAVASASPLTSPFMTMPFASFSATTWGSARSTTPCVLFPKTDARRGATAWKRWSVRASAGAEARKCESACRRHSTARI